MVIATEMEMEVSQRGHRIERKERLSSQEREVVRVAKAAREVVVAVRRKDQRTFSQKIMLA